MKCGAELDVSALPPGTRLRCGSCGAVLRVPREAEAAPAAGPRAAARAEAAAAARKFPLFVVAGAAVVLVGGAVAWFAGRSPATKPPAAPPVALVPPSAAPKDAPRPAPKPVDPEAASWTALSSEEARASWVEERLPASRESAEKSKALREFLAGKGRSDLAARVVEARLSAAPDDAWANGVLGRTDCRKALEEIAAAPGLAKFPIPESVRLAERLGEGRTWIGPGRERDALESDLKAVRDHVEKMKDPWYLEMLLTVEAVRSMPAFGGGREIDPVAWSPYVLMAQHQTDAMSQATSNVLERHSRMFQCLTKNFLRIMGEAGLPKATVAEMGNPVLKAFIFTDRGAFERFHGRDAAWLRGIRAYYAWGSTQFMMLYDTGAPTATQDDDTCVAFHEATHQLVHYYRRYYLGLEDRKGDPSAPFPDLLDPRLHGRAHWFGEGFAEFFGGANRLGQGEWKLFCPLQNRIKEWGDPTARKDPQFTLREVLQMVNKPQLDMMGEQKWPGHGDAMHSLFYAEAWALNHYLYFGKDGKYRARYLGYVNEEMRCNSGYGLFLKCMEAGDDDEAREMFLVRLEREWREYQRKMYFDAVSGGR
jgi:hypothetical protein